MEEHNRVFFYSYDVVPAHSGSGAHLRLYSNLRAYLDLGYHAQCVVFTEHAAPSQLTLPPDLDETPRRFCAVSPSAASIGTRLAYAAGFPIRRAWPRFFHSFSAVRAVVDENIRSFPTAVHHFEYPATGNVIPWTSAPNTIYSVHEIETDFIGANLSIDRDLEGRQRLSAWENRKLRFARKAERLIASRSAAVIGICDRDVREMQTRWGLPHIYYLPMSVPDISDTTATSEAKDTRTLRLLHLGWLAHIPNYSSLEFIFEKLFPHLPKDVLENLRLDVVGLISDDGRCRRILELGRPYPQVRFHGRVADLAGFYRSCDLQIVASTKATGLRTRILESFARRLPVLSSVVAADGLDGLESGHNILLAETPDDFAKAIETAARDRAKLRSVAAGARALYEARHTRPVVAAKLAGILERSLIREERQAKVSGEQPVIAHP